MSELRIHRVVGHIVECGLDFTYASGTLSRARAVIWEIHAGGHVGLGECGISTEKSRPGFDAGDASGASSTLQ